MLDKEERPKFLPKIIGLRRESLKMTIRQDLPARSREQIKQRIQNKEHTGAANLLQGEHIQKEDYRDQNLNRQGTIQPRKIEDRMTMVAGRNKDNVHTVGEPRSRSQSLTH